MSKVEGRRDDDFYGQTNSRESPRQKIPSNVITTLINGKITVISFMCKSRVTETKTGTPYETGYRPLVYIVYGIGTLILHNVQRWGRERERKTDSTSTIQDLILLRKRNPRFYFLYNSLPRRFDIKIVHCTFSLF